jgi:glucose-1-phosphate thymidylyltransferase
MRGIILAGGSGTRLSPLTDVISKQLLPVYNKPMIYYPLSTLMLAGIKEILLISTPRDIPIFKSLLGDGSKFGISISYETQDKPNGIAEALIIGEKFLDGQKCALILGDNLLYGPGLGRDLINQIGNTGATILAHHISNPKDFGVIEFDSNDDPVRIIEKPQNSESNWAIPGLYFYDESASKRAKNLKPSSRGEREISDLNSDYLSEGKLKVIKMPRGTAWLDLGTPDSLLEAGKFIQIVEERQGLEVGNPTNVAEVMGFLNTN